MKRIIIILAIIVCGLSAWQCIEYFNANSRVIPEIRLQEIEFPENPGLKERICGMVAEMDPETKRKPVYLVNIFNDTPHIMTSNLIVMINWYKNPYFCYDDDYSGYFREGNSLFIVGMSDVWMRIVDPGKSWRTFKSQPAYPLFGKNVRWSYSFEIDSCGFSPKWGAVRMEFDDKTAQNYRDSLQNIIDERENRGEMDAFVRAIEGYGYFDYRLKLP